ncbi:uracil-DNA glycosylase [Thiomicrorhabdus sp. ZW0627]|uniref:uracil-DNA glycosylase n=1 Tax=Thiomicrorhabdus sp. ZW0627 TaxID=3039774 RepID=UPI0024369E5B|nr:uracil-DNA glycosylase [Thiomicrorhabdus sp. ZW0627]MDG6772836.1 uracil-DNA glycosylase [Thiomicrorhabdus sp. ZW0627]
MKKTNSIDCFKCRHFYITWDANQPRGCKAFGFKSKRLPSQVVLETSGEACKKFSPKEEPPKKTPPKTGWIA